ncbi:hypothetical protein Mgra_00009458 [Meloidogyne graminicola]|uniref:Uncharacterized protein n=1 Tax=Meloidogyne graminicola TaxID=189291 RepID=A0A8S9ZC49_9BILA|nr:hypothetical protein Mgra_00009458 [Meloidogyne graminicola]
MSFIDEFICRRGILLNSFVDLKEEELDTEDLEVALINESFEEQMKQSQLLYSSDLKSLFYAGGQTTTTFSNSDQTHSHKHKYSTDSPLLIKIVPTCSPIRLPHITPNSDFDDSERGRQLDMELGRMMLEGDDEDEATFMNSLDDNGSKSASSTKLDKCDGIECEEKTEETENILNNDNESSRKLPSSLNSTSLLEQTSNNKTPATNTSVSYYNISSLTFLPYHHMAGGFFSSSSFESNVSQQEDDDQQSACADAAEAIAFDVVQSLFADEQYSHSELGATDDETEEDYEEEDNSMLMNTTGIFSNSSSSSSTNDSFSSCSSFCQINRPTENDS